MDFDVIGAICIFAFVHMDSSSWIEKDESNLPNFCFIAISQKDIML